jgi:hypothetical protein
MQIHHSNISPASYNPACTGHHTGSTKTPEAEPSSGTTAGATYLPFPNLLMLCETDLKRSFKAFQ